MLILSRKLGERVCIGKEVCVNVLEVRGNRVKLGITAPPEVTVHREEIHDKLNGCVEIPIQASACG
jgi:carbon storage regulator